MCGSVHYSSKCNHVLGCIVLHKEELMLEKSSLQKKCFLALPIY